MGIVLIITVIIGIWCIYSISQQYLGCDDIFMGILITFGVFLISFLLMCFVNIPDIGKESYLEKSYPILSLEDNISNNFRYAYDTSKYYYMTTTEKGKIVKTSKIDETYIKESDNPKIDIYNVRYKNKIVNWLLNIEINGCGDYKYNVIYVPKEAIKLKFNIDMKE